MSQLPTGTVTFLFTDIEGSTARWDAQPEAMRAALERHDALMRAAVEAHGGHVFKTVGDAFCAAFATAGAGLAAAIEAQRAVAGEDWTAFGEGFAPIRVRMGLHTGEATERGGDYFGQPVNRVARIEAAGHGGQILLSSETRRLVEAEGFPVGCGLRDHGEHRLKDLRHSERITQAVVEGLPDVTRAPRTAGDLSARDRIQVLSPNARVDAAGPTVVDRSVAETMGVIEAALHRDTAAAILTSDQVIAAARHKPADWREYRLGRVAEWSQPRYRLDGRFVGLTLLIDQGEESVQGRWAAKEERYDDLVDLLAATADPAIVVLGPPGGGKSTLLRRLELDTAIAGLRGEDDSAERATFFVSLNTYKPAEPGQPLPAPGKWLSAQWQARNPDLPSLDALLAEGRVSLLLDALNEMPAASESDFRQRVQLWKGWLQHLAATRPGNRVVFSCRSLDYSQPLSTPELRVPQVRIEPLTDEQIRDFLAVYSPGRWREIWAALDGSPQIEVLRSPYFLALLVEQVEATGEMPAGRAALFTGFVRQALRREVERDNPHLESGELLDSRDLRRIAKWQWKDAYDLPDRGKLLPKLADLAHAMQRNRDDGGSSQVRVDFDEALGLLGDSAAETIVAAGELMYIHQLVQEYFAARELALQPEPELVRAAWRATETRPGVDEVIDTLDPADPLPVLPQTGWEETTLLAAAMADVPAAFVKMIAGTNLVLAARCAAQPEVMARMPAQDIEMLRVGLVARMEDAGADLRHRIACGDVLGALGDPRFERREGPYGPYLLSPLVDIPGGLYPIGDDEPIEWSVTGAGGSTSAHVPRHHVEIAPFAIGRFPVTNAEWACFMNAGGYDDERWWDTPFDKAWQSGAMANEGSKANNRVWRRRFLEDPTLFERMVEEGRFANDETLERWKDWINLEESAFEAALQVRWQARRDTEPEYWRDKRFNGPAQPVVGVCWFEARAYCAWLSAQTGLEMRLPTEVEWESATRGREARDYSFGEVFDRLASNTLQTCLKRPTPVGVFPSGQTPEGVDDLNGNVFEWTSSLFGEFEVGHDVPEYAYPYASTDGRENANAGPSTLRVLRGGSWSGAGINARAACRFRVFPTERNASGGFRVVCASPIPMALSK